MKKLFVAGLLASALLASGALTLHTYGGSIAQAQSDAKSIVDAAKNRGEIGEQIDGYLGVVSSASPAVRAAMDEINIGRKAVYTRLAREQNVRVEVVARLTGEKQIAKATTGQYVLGDDGRWTQK